MTLEDSKKSLMEQMTLSKDLREVRVRAKWISGEECSGQEESNKGPEATVLVCSRNSKKAGEAEAE